MLHVVMMRLYFETGSTYLREPEFSVAYGSLALQLPSSCGMRPCETDVVPSSSIYDDYMRTDIVKMGTLPGTLAVIISTHPTATCIS